MLINIVILVSKDSSGNFCGIRLLYEVWKIIEGVLDIQIKCVPLQSSLRLPAIHVKSTRCFINAELKMKKLDPYMFVCVEVLTASLVGCWLTIDVAFQKRSLVIGA